MDTTFKQLPAEPVSAKTRFTHWALIIFTITLTIRSTTGINSPGIKTTAGQITGVILNGLIHPDRLYIYSGTGEDLISQLWEALCIIFLDTFISTIISILFAFWAATAKNKKWYVSRSGKFVLTSIRCFPGIISALMFIRAVGSDSTAEVLALGSHSVGMLAMLFSEVIESSEDGPNEAVITSGGSKQNAVMFATLSNLTPTLVPNILYRSDVSVHSASILGIVGTGGIGYPLTTALNYCQWNRVGTILIGIIVMIVSISWIFGAIRKKSV